ncbi:MAG: hypothetical protein ACRD5Z_05895 [Bryobacteraceae bacterium]
MKRSIRIAYLRRKIRQMEEDKPFLMLRAAKMADDSPENDVRKIQEFSLAAFERALQELVTELEKLTERTR